MLQNLETFRPWSVQMKPNMRATRENPNPVAMESTGMPQPKKKIASKAARGLKHTSPGRKEPAMLVDEMQGKAGNVNDTNQADPSKDIPSPMPKENGALTTVLMPSNRECLLN
jgi:hypothetical protein